MNRDRTLWLYYDLMSEQFAARYPRGFTNAELAHRLRESIPAHHIGMVRRMLMRHGRVKDSGERRERKVVWVFVRG